MRHTGARPTFLGPHITLCIAATLAGCATVPTQRSFVAASNKTVLSVTHARFNELAQVVSVENRSSERVRVTAYRLEDCQNIREKGGMNPAQIEIPAGTKRQIIVVHPRRDIEPYCYSFGFLWTPIRGRGDVSIRH